MLPFAGERKRNILGGSDSIKLIRPLTRIPEVEKVEHVLSHYDEGEEAG
jgi:hypothetical protein